MSTTLATLSDAHHERLLRERVLPRLLQRDATLWREEHRDEAAGRSGWLDLPAATPRELPAWRGLREEARSEGVNAILLLGMGGSSLGAATLSQQLPRGPDSPSATVCDSTHPDHVRPILERLQPRRTWLVVATKSGTTAETRALAAVFRRWIRDAGGEPDRQSLAVTDAGSVLAAAAASWRAVLTPPSDVGGRFSALSGYGLLLPTLAGIDVEPVLAGASRLLARLRRGEAEAAEPLLATAASLAAAAQEGWPVSVRTHPAQASAWCGWLEQLLAESLGKDGDGLIPVAGGSGHIPGWRFLGVDFVFDEGASWLDERARGGDLVRPLPAPQAIGAEMLTWELITSLVAWCLGVFPFDQPDVERAKRAARRALAGETEATRQPQRLPSGAGAGRSGRWIEDELSAWLDTARDCAYATVQLFAPQGHRLAAAVDDLCGALARAFEHPVTWGYGPRYLHSTGQLQKGGPRVAVLQLLVPPRGGDLEVPDEAFALWGLLEAQAKGDAAALRALDRPVLRIALDGVADEAMQALRQVLHTVAPRSAIV